MTKSFNKQKIALILAICLLTALIAVALLVSNGDKASAETTADTSNLRFALNTEQTAYKVSALSRQLTEANIPDTYNGLPVTEIANNGFMNCPNLVSVTIAKSVTKVGGNAFYNCKNLETVVGMAGVTDMGSNAFANCTKLDNLILPPSITTLGSNIIRNSARHVYARLSEEEMNAMNSAWNDNLAETTSVEHSNVIIHEPIMENDSIIGYSIRRWQVLNYQEYVTVPTIHEGLPVLEVQNCAFDDTNCDYLTIERTGNYDRTLNICSSAFLGNQAMEITIEVDVSFNDSEEENGISQSVFAGAMASKIKLPGNITAIPDSLFSLCLDLKEIIIGDEYSNHLPATITKIGERAFEECYALADLYIPSSVTEIGNAAFIGWGTNPEQTLYIDRYAPADNWTNPWTDGMEKDFVVTYKTMTVPLVKDGGFGGSDYIEVSYGKPLPQAQYPGRGYYAFQGYYTQPNGEGEQWYTKAMQGCSVWNVEQPIALYAYWTPYACNVTLSEEGGVNGTVYINAYYGQPMPEAQAPEREGYEFDGYYAQKNGQGTKYYNADMTSAANWSISSVSTLYANWIAKKYLIVFDKNGGVGGTDYVYVEYGKSLPISLQTPKKEYFSFQGYYYTHDGIEEQCFSSTMRPLIRPWTTAEDVVLVAKWAPIDVWVTFKLQNGEADIRMPCHVGQQMESIGWTANRRGYMFLGFFTEEHGGTQYIRDDMSSAHICDFKRDTTLYAQWEMILYHIEYYGIDPYDNSNPQFYTIEDIINNGPIVFEQPLNCSGSRVYEFMPAQITLDDVGTTGVSVTWRQKNLWETKTEENGNIIYYIYDEVQFLDMNDERVLMGENVIFYLEADLNFRDYSNAAITRTFVGTFDRQGYIIVGIDFVYGAAPQNVAPVAYSNESTNVEKSNAGTLERDAEILKDDGQSERDENDITE